MGTSKMSDIEIDVEIIATTPNAIYVENLKGDGSWIPRSQISDYSGSEEKPDSIFIGEWLATQKDLI